MNQENVIKAKVAIKQGESQQSIPLLILLMGLPGTGKSYVASHLHQQYQFTILSGENITHAIFGREKCTAEEYKEAYAVVHFYAHEFISAGYNVVIDATNSRYDHRQQIYDAVAGVPHAAVVIQLLASDDTSLHRIQNRGVNQSDPQNIQSSISLETYQSFKENTEDPRPDEVSYRVTSDEHVLASVDQIIDRQTAS